MFGSLAPSGEGRKRRGAAFICAFAAESLVIAALIFLEMVFPQELPLTNKHYLVTWLSLPKPPAERVLKPPPKVVRVFVPKLKPPENPELSDAPVIHMEIPKVQPTISAEVTIVPQPPLPPKPVAQPNPTPTVQFDAHPGYLAGAPEPVTTKRPLNQVQTGGFGSPQGFPGRAQGDSPGNVPKLGSFGLPEGPGVGNGTGGSHGIQGVVASAGFGSGIAGPGSSGGRGGTGGSTVTMGVFEKVVPVAHPGGKAQDTAAHGFPARRDILQAYPGLHGGGTPVGDSRRGHAFRGLPGQRRDQSHRRGQIPGTRARPGGDTSCRTDSIQASPARRQAGGFSGHLAHPVPAGRPIQLVGGGICRFFASDASPGYFRSWYLPPRCFCPWRGVIDQSLPRTLRRLNLRKSAASSIASLPMSGKSARSWRNSLLVSRRTFSTISRSLNWATFATNDEYFLGRLKFSKKLDNKAQEASFIPESTAERLRRTPDMLRRHLRMDQFAVEALVVDENNFDRKHYTFDPVRWEYLGDIRCLAIDVHPRDPKTVGAFEGRIWVEDHDYAIVRLNGTRINPPRWDFYVHFDCWRENLQPGVVAARLHLQPGNGPRQATPLQGGDAVLGLRPHRPSSAAGVDQYPGGCPRARP